MQIDRREGADIDLGLLRHWLDPTVPFAEQVLGSAHGVAVTSATLKDEIRAEAGDAQAGHEGWASAKLLSGAAHLAHPALLSEHASPFDYARQSRIFIVNDVVRDRADGVAALWPLMIAAEGAGPVHFYHASAQHWGVRRLSEADIPLYAQHMDRMNLQTLLQLFREDRRSVLIGTDGVGWMPEKRCA